jgi:hypothetical protein
MVNFTRPDLLRAWNYNITIPRGAATSATAGRAGTQGRKRKDASFASNSKGDRHAEICNERTWKKWSKPSCITPDACQSTALPAVPRHFEVAAYCKKTANYFLYFTDDTYKSVLFTTACSFLFHQSNRLDKGGVRGCAKRRAAIDSAQDWTDQAKVLSSESFLLCIQSHSCCVFPLTPFSLQSIVVC